jgi:hypothetical protein
MSLVRTGYPELGAAMERRMFDLIDECYYRQRAEEEKARALNSADVATARIHQQLATVYEQKLRELHAGQSDL